MEKAGRRNGLPGEALDQPVIAPATCDGAELHRLALLVGHVEQQFALVDRAGVVLEPADNGRVDLDLAFRVTRTTHKRLDQRQFFGAFVAVDLAGRNVSQNLLRLSRIQPGTLGKVAGLILAAFTQQKRHAFGAELVELVDGAQHGELLTVIGHADGFHHAIQHLAVVHPDTYCRCSPALPWCRPSSCTSRHPPDVGRAHRIGVELHELAEPPGPGFSLRNT
jgi:hypothetical protein